MDNKYKIPLKHDLCKTLSFTDRYQMAKVKPYVGDVPSDIISFSRARLAAKGRPYTAIHFFIYDYFFECVWSSPERYIEMFKRFWGIISPDYSHYANMTMPDVMWNSSRNKKLAAFYQQKGINVIPNVSWSRPWSYDFCFDGVPKKSVIAINSTSVGYDSFSTDLWIRGYEKAIETLEPVKIIRYGAKQKGEDESISVYFPNDNHKLV